MDNINGIDRYNGNDNLDQIDKRLTQDETPQRTSAEDQFKQSSEKSSKHK